MQIRSSYILVLFFSAVAVFGTEQFVSKATPLGRAVPIVSSNTVSDHAELSTTINFADDRILLGDTHNAFVGRVLRKIGNRHLPATPGPSSQYEVNIISNIKGNLQGIVTVNQFEFDTPFLQLGSTYVFATRYHRDEGVYIIVYYPYQYQLLTDDVTLSDEQLKTLAENNDRVKALQVAYPNEELGSDIRDHMTWNSYASRHYDAQGQLIDDTVVLHEQYLAAHPSTAPTASPTDSASTAPAAQAPAPAAAPANNPATSSAPSDVPPSDVASPTATPGASASPTPTPDQVIAPTDSPTPTPMPTPTPTPSTVPAAS
jgi:hypothetical protein